MVMLVTPEQANTHLRTAFDLDESPLGPEVEDLLLKIEQASEIALDYLKHDGTAFSALSPQVPWDEDTVPRPVQSAVLLLLGSLYRDREDSSGRGDTDLLAPSGTVARLLHRFRDPALA